MVIRIPRKTYGVTGRKKAARRVDKHRSRLLHKISNTN